MVSLALFVFDALLLNQIFVLTFSLWLGSEQQMYIYLNSYYQVRWVFLGLYTGFGLLSGIFDIRKLGSASDIFSHVTNSLLASFVGFNLLAFFSRTIASYAHTFPRPIFLLATGLSIVSAFLLRAIVSSLFRPHPRLVRAIIIGDHVEGRRIIKHFHRRGGVRFRIVHVMAADQVDELAAEVVFRHAHEVFVTNPSIDLDNFWAQIYYQRKEEPHDFKVRISVDPRKAAGTVGLQSLEDFPLITIASRPMDALQRFVKRSFDIGFSIFALLVSMPVMVTAALLVRLDSPGPVFYKQKRVGRYGKEFDVIKFRSMRVGSEAKVGPTVATADDPRISKLGKFLRRTGIDELPQFFLVLTGEMSVVGPRPERPFFVKDYYEFQGRRLSVKPGVTGLAAVNSRYYLRLVDKVTYDYFYLDNYSIVLDIKIVFQTVWVLLFESNKALHDQHHELDKMKKMPGENDQSGAENDN
ncbi:MAG: sugar transferase [Candidatus Riflebacteria bacterium]|nr:sugar transferase [Candidatus Riflebacteria bacterium]